MKRTSIWAKLALGIVCSLAFFPCVAFADPSMDGLAVNPAVAVADGVAGDVAQAAEAAEAASASGNDSSAKDSQTLVAAKSEEIAQAVESKKAENEAREAQAKAKKAEKKNKVLEYDRKLIKKIGTQESTGHTICCPSFSCAYADAVMDGTVHDHEYYTCSCCTWPDWGGGNSSFRCVGDDQELLREAYDQIRKGKPTVIHVYASTGEHWIALIGYKNVKDPDNLKLSNFIALDPWDGAQIKASDRYELYGDGCEHVSDRKAKKG